MCFSLVLIWSFLHITCFCIWNVRITNEIINHNCDLLCTYVYDKQICICFVSWFVYNLNIVPWIVLIVNNHCLLPWMIKIGSRFIVFIVFFRFNSNFFILPQFRCAQPLKPIYCNSHFHSLHSQIMTATVETVAEQLDLAAIMPAEKVVAAVARSVTLSDADVGTHSTLNQPQSVKWIKQLNYF